MGALLVDDGLGLGRHLKEGKCGSSRWSILRPCYGPSVGFDIAVAEVYLVL